ncbi:MAG: AAA family ATPase [Gammaproteobacteria bacterium]|nr:AAA family ATPase [Gammaproteobacteria bacterium]
MKIHELYLKNYRCFDEFQIDFDPRLTVIVAENGAGKTAILDAIKVAFGTFIGGFDTAPRKDFANSDIPVREVKKNSPWQKEDIFPLHATARGEIKGEKVQWQRERTGRNSGTTKKEAQLLTDYAKALQEQVRSGKDVMLPLSSVNYFFRPATIKNPGQRQLFFPSNDNCLRNALSTGGLWFTSSKSN